MLTYVPKNLKSWLYFLNRWVLKANICSTISKSQNEQKSSFSAILKPRPTSTFKEQNLRSGRVLERVRFGQNFLIRVIWLNHARRWRLLCYLFSIDQMLRNRGDIIT